MFAAVQPLFAAIWCHLPLSRCCLSLSGHHLSLFNIVCVVLQQTRRVEMFKVGGSHSTPVDATASLLWVFLMPS
ncbi:hypothetical protein VIGAN_01173700 [Vigna angularis var. angularis]|uniref:Secreted protein n=1 Tax=Vigna angularis var. angularis TaxID=157739 RepID=A0A0S3R0R5_PHAAN|nr:hypothetical protein VIGAN_01173700 [Vigna angularis var. angularis]